MAATLIASATYTTVIQGLRENMTVGESFLGTGLKIGAAKFLLKQGGTGTPFTNDYLQAKLYATTGVYGSGATITGSPLAVSDTMLASRLGTVNAEYTFTFSGANQYTMANGTCYIILVGLYGSDNNSRDVYSYGYYGPPSGYPGDAYASDVNYTLEGDAASCVTWFRVYSDGIILINSYATSTSTVSLYNADGAWKKYGECFSNAASDYYLTSCKFALKSVGTPPGDMVAVLYAITGTPGTDAIPTGSALSTSEVISTSVLTSSEALIEFTFATPYKMAANTYYSVDFEYHNGDSNNYIKMSKNNATFPNKNLNGMYHEDTVWSSSTSNAVFYVYGTTEEPIAANTSNFFNFI